jgi:hypothetical protein
MHTASCGKFRIAKRELNAHGCARFTLIKSATLLHTSQKYDKYGIE